MTSDNVWEGTAVPKWIPLNSATIFKDPDHNPLIQQVFKVLDGMQNFQKNGAFCDISINVEGKTFRAHKVVLAASSDYFEAMLNDKSDFKEGLESEVALCGKSEIFQILLDFAYSGMLNLSVEAAVDVLEMAQYLQFHIVMKRCESFLNEAVTKESIGIPTCIRILKSAEMFELKNLKTSCKKFLAENFKASKEFLSCVSAELLGEMLDGSELMDEKEVFDTTVAWLQHDWKGRKQYTPALFKKIRLGTIPMGHLSITVFRLPDLYAIPECKDLIEKVLRLTDSRKPSDPPLYNIHPNLFATRTTVKAIFGIEVSRVIGAQFYDTSAKAWVMLKNFPQLPKKDCKDTPDSLCNAQGNLYIVRGTSPYTPRKLMYPQFIKLDVSSNKWVTLPPNRNRTSSCHLVALDDKIHAFNVSDGVCEVYNIKENNWKMLHAHTHLDIGLKLASCTAYAGKILLYKCSSTSREGDAEHSLTVFNPISNRWSNLMKVNLPASSDTTALVVHEGKCYRVIGPTVCACTDESCPWHEYNVHELIIDLRNNTAILGEKQPQTVMKTNTDCICIAGDVFRVFQGKIFNTGIKVLDEERDAKCNQYRGLEHAYIKDSTQLLTSFMFDKATWL